MKFIVREDDREYEFLLTPGLYIVGRDRTCDLPLDSKGVSRRHMSCAVGEGQVVVKDLGSRNGIRVGGIQVDSATLKDGDRVRLGELELVFSASAPAAEGAQGGAAAVHAAGAELPVQDAEILPSARALVVKQEAASGPQLLERKGRWYVADPATGREVEIVPAEQARRKPMKLLSTKKGKLIVGALAAAVALLFVVVLLRAALLGTPQTAQMSAEQYDKLLESALASLERGDIAQAKLDAGRARAGMPSRESAQIVLELAGLWGPWREDFFAHWVKVEDALKELSRYQTNPAVAEFVKKYRDWIRKEIDYSEKSQDARQLFQAGRYEEAWRNLKDIPQGSAVRERDAEFFQEAADRARRQLEGEMKTAAARQDWQSALQSARKLQDYFPDHKQTAEESGRAYKELANQASLMQSAKTALAKKDFPAAQQALRGIPESSPYHGEAVRLLERVKADETYTVALGRYTGKDGPGALELLSKEDSQAARSLRDHIQAVMKLYSSAQQAEKDKRLAEAERLWTGLVEVETDADNQYRKEALRMLSQVKPRRKDSALELVRQAEELYKQEQFEKAREIYELANSTDPDGLAGQEALKRMVEQGRMDYRRALNMTDDRPSEALQLLKRACRLLPPDDKYYTWAADKKAELERKLAKP